MPKPIMIEAVTIPDAWFQALYNIFDEQYTYIQHINRGSFEGQTRRQFANFGAKIMKPYLDFIPRMPEGSNLPPPTDRDYVEDYFCNYLMRPELQDNEEYTYGNRIAQSLDQVIEMLRVTPETNQAVIEIGRPEDVILPDPPCLRTLTFKVINGTLNIGCFFRSWDLWGGFPSNLPGLELLKQYVADQAELGNGSMNVWSDGLHIYGMHEEVARLRIRK